MTHLRKWSLLYAVLSATGLALVAVLALSPGGQPSPVAGEPDHEGPNRPYALGDDNDFQDPTKAYVREGSCPSNCAGVDPGEVGEYREFRFSASVLEDKAITGVEVQVGVAPGTDADTLRFRLLDGSENPDPVGDERSTTVPGGKSYPADPETEPKVGGSDDLWGLGCSAEVGDVELTPDLVTDEYFGVEIKNDSTGTGLNLDYVRITVYYDADSDGDCVPDDVDNCPTVPNGPREAGTPGVGNQDNTDKDLGEDGAKYNATPIGDADGDACDTDDDDDGFTDTLEQGMSLPTNEYDNCYGGPPLNVTPGPGTGSDPWPADLNADGSVNTTDTDYFTKGNFNKPADTWIRQRLDLDGNTTVNILDIVKLPVGATCE